MNSKINFIKELEWRGMLQDIMPGTEELLNKETVTAYIGFDPTSDSLHVGSLAQIMLLKHLQKAGHQPIALVGGATGMIGDPSGKMEERKLLSEEDINRNILGIQSQLEKFLDFDAKENSAGIVNNHDWFKNIMTIHFLRDVGKYLTVSYLLNKGFVKDRLAQEKDLSFTEFNYILMQAYDFLWLFENKHCKLQMGGSDQWGNITAGVELIRKKIKGEAFGLTIKLITKSDGTKFGKTESGNVWLDRKKTSPYKFYQFWLNASDEDAKNYMRIFTMLNQEDIESIEAAHAKAPHERLLQKTLAKDITERVHSVEDFQSATEASEILFGNSTTDALRKLDEETLLSVFEGVPQLKIGKDQLSNMNIVELLSGTAKIFSSKREAREMIKAGGTSINKLKITDVNHLISTDILLNGKYVLVQKGKKNYYLLIAE